MKNQTLYSYEKTGLISLSKTSVITVLICCTRCFKPALEIPFKYEVYYFISVAYLESVEQNTVITNGNTCIRRYSIVFDSLNKCIFQI